MMRIRLGLRARVILALMLPVAISTTACGSSVFPTGPDPDPRTFLVGGYVMLGGTTASGSAALFDPMGVLVATTIVATGRYELGLRLPEGSVVCEGYRIRVSIAERRDTRTDEVVLDDSSGACVVPLGDRIRHRVDFQFARTPTGSPE